MKWNIIKAISGKALKLLFATLIAGIIVLPWLEYLQIESILKYITFALSVFGIWVFIIFTEWTIKTNGKK